MPNNNNLSTLELDFNKIEIDPFLTPECLQLKGLLDRDPEKEQEYESLFSDLKDITECFKVWKRDDRYFLLENYEAYCAAKRCRTKPSAASKVHTMVFHYSDPKIAKELSNRLRELRGVKETYWMRCFNLLLLRDLKLSVPDIYRFYGIRKRKSTKGKMLERDFKLIQHEPVYRRVLGFMVSESLTSEILLLKNKPSPANATLTYAMALDVLKILRHDPQLVDKFEIDYEDYLQDLRANHIYPGEEVKPIHKWQNYNKSRVKDIAIAVSRNGELLLNQKDLLLGNSAYEDRSFRAVVNKSTYDLPLPNFRINLASKHPENLRKIVDLKYKIEIMSKTLDAYLWRLKPVLHGATTPIHDSTLTPFLETQSNLPKFEDKRYLKYIREHNLLYYCNRELLLKSIGLRPDYFCFKSYDYRGISTWKKSVEAYFAWTNDTFDKLIQRKFNGDRRQHPLWPIYEKIERFLTKKSNNDLPITFQVFIQETFADVFNQLDKEEEVIKVKLEAQSKNEDLLKNVLNRSIQEKLDIENLSERDVVQILQKEYGPKFSELLDTAASLQDQLLRFEDEFKQSA